jgi:serine/threonine-protein kinase
MAEQVTMLAVEPPAPTGATRPRRSTTLPPYLLAKARSRLSFLTLLFAGMCVVGFVLDRLFADLYPGRGSIYPVFVFNFVTSSLLFVLTRRRRVPDRVVLNLGLAYEILMCLSVSIAYTWLQYQRSGTPSDVTWVCIVLVAYPLIIPTPPRRTLVVAALAAATVPLGLYLLATAGWITPSPLDYVDISISPALCVALAVMGSRVIYGLNVEVARARQLGSYQLIERLGAGGMGEVWRARHRLLARPAAIKLVRPELQQSSSLDVERVMERFRREAEVTACLHSPHTVSLYDFGTTDEGVFYYVMELLNGLDLETMIRKHGPLPPERAVHVLLQVCHSLREAHDHGLVHRDIKPANLFLCHRRACDHDVVKVLDFGLVALRPESHPGEARLTAHGQVGGTPAYMPPEAIAEGSVDARADIYALGCVAYWLVTGQLVFEADTPMKIALAHVRDTPVAPSQRTEVAIPATLEALIMACLEKTSANRPQTADELEDRLKATGLAPIWSQERAHEWWQLHHPLAEECRPDGRETGPDLTLPTDPSVSSSL